MNPRWLSRRAERGHDDALKLDTWDNHVVLSSIRIPLAAFSGIDLNNVQSIALLFDATDRGAIFLTDLELLRTTDMTKQTRPEGTTPEYVKALEAAYGAPSQAAFGSAVFHEELKASDHLEQAAFAKYKYFVGEQWERFGEAAWKGPWKVVYSRQPGAKHDIVAELRGIADRARGNQRRWSWTRLRTPMRHVRPFRRHSTIRRLRSLWFTIWAMARRCRAFWLPAAAARRARRRSWSSCWISVTGCRIFVRLT